MRQKEFGDKFKAKNIWELVFYILIFIKFKNKLRKTFNIKIFEQEYYDNKIRQKDIGDEFKASKY